MTVMRWYVQDEVNQEESEQNADKNFVAWAGGVYIQYIHCQYHCVFIPRTFPVSTPEKVPHLKHR